mgnify:CR=1 FL=1
MNLKAKLVGLFAANGLHWLAVLTLLLGVIYCSAALFLALSPALGAAGAALATGGFNLALVLIPLSVFGLRKKPKRNEKPQDKASPEQAEHILKSLLGDATIEEWVKGNSKQAALAALAAGVVAGASPKARQGVMRLLEEFAQKD